MGEKLTKPSGSVHGMTGILLGTFTTDAGGNELDLECDPPLGNSSWVFGAGVLLGGVYRHGPEPVGPSVDVACIERDTNGNHCIRWTWKYYDENGQLVAEGTFV